MKLRSGNLFALSAASEESEWFLAGKIANSCKGRKRARVRATGWTEGGGFVAVSIPLAMLVRRLFLRRREDERERHFFIAFRRRCFPDYYVRVNSLLRLRCARVANSWLKKLAVSVSET